MSTVIVATVASALHRAGLILIVRGYIPRLNKYRCSIWKISEGSADRDFQFLLTFWTISFPVSSITVHFNGICIIFHSMLEG